LNKRAEVVRALIKADKKLNAKNNSVFAGNTALAAA